MTQKEILITLLHVQAGLADVAEALDAYAWDELASECRRVHALVSKLFDAVRAAGE